MSRKKILVGVFTGVILPLALVATAQDSPVLEVEPTSGLAGSDIALSGSGYTVAPEDITVQFSTGQAMENTAVAEDGQVTGAALVPIDAQPGMHQVEVCVSSGTRFEPGFESECADADFEVLDPDPEEVEPEPEVVEPELTVSPESGTPGTPFELTGSGLPQGSPPDWDIGWGHGNTVVGSATVAPDGSATGAGTVPIDAGEGAVPIAICRGLQNPTCYPVERDFQVRHPEITTTPSELPAGNPFELSGEEWCCPGQSGQVVHVGSGDIWGEVAVDENRSLRGTAVVPGSIDPGEHPIQICVLALCRRALIAVTPVPITTVPPGECGVETGSLVVEPASGMPGSRIRVVLTAVGASPQNCRASVEMGGENLGQVVELRPGEQSVTDALVPTDLPAGPVDLVALDAESGRVLASTSFNVEGLTTDQAFPWPWVAGTGIALVAMLGGIWMVTRSRPGVPVDLLGGPADPEPTAAAFPVIPVRWIEARLYARGDTGEEPVAYFRAGATHRIEVRVGPVQTVEASTVPQVMRVILTEPNLMGSPQNIDIMLRDGTPSTSASFALRVPSDAASVEGRLLLVSGNRVVQTARLPALVGQPPAIQSTNVAATETVVRAAGLMPTSVVSGSLTVEGGRFPLVTHVSEGGSARLIRLPDIGAAAIEKIRHRLGEVAHRPNEFAGLENEGTRELLVFLANHGRLLRSAVVSDFLGEELAASRSIQMVSTSRDAYLPLEFAYDHPAPHESASVCPHAGAILRSRNLLAQCPGAHDETVVCPLGFWGLSKVIERHAYQPREDLPDGFLVSAQPISGRNRITWGGGIILAASNRVDAHDAGASERLRGRLESLVDPYFFVETWSAWDQRVRRSKPSILLLLPHTIYSDELELPGLEIGESDRRLVSGIEKESGMIPDTPAIVILLGCETAVAGAVSYEQFPGNLRIAGAGIVIATLTEVLGRHAAPLAERLVMLLTDDDSMTKVGETVVWLRRQLLAEGMPMVLALAVFGDADWLIGGQ